MGKGTKGPKGFSELRDEKAAIRRFGDCFLAKALRTHLREVGVWCWSIGSSPAAPQGREHRTFKVVEGTPLADGRRLKYRLNGETQIDDLMAPNF